MSRISRRRFLGTTAATAGTAAFANLTSVLHAAMAVSPAGNSMSSIKHVVILMQENRSFDHYLGSLKGVRGFNDRTAISLQNGNKIWEQPNSSGSSAFTLPFHFDTATTSAQCVSDLDHGWDGTHQAWNGGKYNSWVPAKTAPTMGYYTRADIPFHYALADGFTVCDNYFCSVMGPTNPNRMYLWTGMIDPNGKNGGPAINNNEPGFTWTTYPEQLQAAAISWKVYQNAKDNYDDNALAWFTQFRNAQPGTPLHDRGIASVPVVNGNNTTQNIAAAIQNDVLNGTLPQVSWIVAGEDHSEHPSNTPGTGADFISQILAALTSDASVWASTVLLINYDENDGFFDHVPPPTPPVGTVDEFVNGVPIGLGPRVPMFVVSPWSRGGYVCSQVFDHTSVLRFLEVWTGVTASNISQWRRTVCGDLTSAFNFSSANTTVPTLPDTAILASQASTQCSTLPPPSVPVIQSMPTQESTATKPACALPYQPNALSSTDVPDGIVWITMTNTGAQSVHYAIYANNYRTDGPWQYDVPSTDGSVKDYFHAQTYGGGLYDLSCVGPNGFLRRFIGNINVAGAALEVVASYDFSTSGAAKLVLTMTNNGTAAVIFTVTSNAYRSDGPWTYNVGPGASVSDDWNVQLYTDCWYDLTATTNIDSLFSRRFAGHVEIGSTSVTG
jgi:phospholipase C